MIKHCEKHGDYEATKTMIHGYEYYTPCPACLAEYEEREKKDKENAEARKLERLGIPKLFIDCTVDNYQVKRDKQKSVVELCQRYITMFPGCSDPLFLVGSYGTGKTHLAIVIMKELFSKGQINNGLYTTTMRMIRDIRGSYHAKADYTEQEAIDKYVDKDLLILDEVGVQNGTDNEKLLIYEVLNGRYENMRPTIIISNYSVNEIKEYLSERVFDRLQSKNKMLAIFNWESERKNQEVKEGGNK